MIDVDVLTVLAPGEEMCAAALEALEGQGAVRLCHYQVVGPPREFGETRASAIARARNRAKVFGGANYALFLDRDVVLPPHGIERLIGGLIARPHHAALAIDYQGKGNGATSSSHVAMGSMLLYRSELAEITFHSEGDLCECWHCCADLRRMGYRVGYLEGLRAEHLKG